MAQFSVEIDAVDSLIRVSGEIDLAAAEAVRDSVERAGSTDSGRAVVLDLAGVTFLDSTGLRELVRPAVRREVVLRRPSAPVRKLLDLTGTAQVFTIEDEDSVV